MTPHHLGTFKSTNLRAAEFMEMLARNNATHSAGSFWTLFIIVAAITVFAAIQA